jgi:hypothetical protein
MSDLEYTIGRDGVYETVGRGFIRSTLRVKGNPRAEEIKEAAMWNAPKIPVSIVQKMLRFFKAVNDKYKTEACAYILGNDTTAEYRLYIPDQWVQGAHCCHHPELREEHWKEISRENSVALFTHLHPPPLTSFHSSEDEAFERSTSPIASMVVSGFDLETANPTVTLSVEGKLFPNQPIENIFDLEEVEDESHEKHVINLWIKDSGWEELVHSGSCPHCEQRPPIQRNYQRRNYFARSHDYWPQVYRTPIEEEIDVADMEEQIESHEIFVNSMVDRLLDNMGDKVVSLPEWCDERRLRYLIEIIFGKQAMKEQILEDMDLDGPQGFEIGKEEMCALEEQYLSEPEESPPTFGTL